jgi:hypothetical protein
MKKLLATKRIAVIAVLLLAFGCAGLQIDTPEKAYLAARDEFNSMLSQYLLHYNSGTPEQQVNWKEQIDPQFEKGNVMLNAWATALKLKEDPAAHEQEFLNLKNALIDMLAGM